MSILRTISLALEDMVVGIEGSFSDMASLMIDPFQKLLRQSADDGTEEGSEHSEPESGDNGGVG